MGFKKPDPKRCDGKVVALSVKTGKVLKEAETTEELVKIMKGEPMRYAIHKFPKRDGTVVQPDPGIRRYEVVAKKRPWWKFW